VDINTAMENLIWDSGT